MNKTNNLYLTAGILSFVLLVLTPLLTISMRVFPFNGLLFSKIYSVVNIILLAFILIVFDRLANKEYRIYNLGIPVYIIIVFGVIGTLLTVLFPLVRYIPILFSGYTNFIITVVAGLGYILMGILLTINFKKLSISLKILMPIVYMEGIYSMFVGIVFLMPMYSFFGLERHDWISIIQVIGTPSMIISMLLYGVLGIIFILNASPKRMDL